MVVEDEPALMDAIKLGLEGEGFAVEGVSDGESALEKVDIAAPDIVVLDVVLPRMSGIDVCRELRTKSQRLPIVMVSGRDSEIDTVVGLEVGADDYVSKPFRMREVAARMRAVLRRSMPPKGSIDVVEGSVELGDVRLDVTRHEVTVRGKVTPMPLKEFELLTALMANAGRVLSRDTLIARVWGENYVGDTKTLDVHIKRLRSRIEPMPSAPTHVLTVRGVGYKFETNFAESAPNS